MILATFRSEELGGSAAVTSHAELAVAFVVGFFPLIGLQALQRVTSKALNLRRVGIRTATDLLKAFSTEQEQGPRAFALPPDTKLPLPVDQLRLLVKVLAEEPGLAPVWNWQRNGVREHRAAP